jgi:ubiquinone/menaquinone biosynthesis C-methylase UbiE
MIHAFALEADLYDEMPGRKGQPDVTFFLDLAREYGGPVLELACGTGRIALPCARMTGDTTGVDLAPAMLEKASDKARKEGLESAVTFLEGDMRSLRLERTFPLVFMGGQPLSFLATDEELKAALETVRIHLVPGGRWAAGVPVFSHLAMLETQDRMRLVCEVRHPHTGQRVAVWNYTSMTEATQIVTRRRITEVLDEDGLVLERRHSVQTLHYRQPAELQRLIQEAGFYIENLYGGYDRQDFGPESRNLVWIARSADPVSGQQQKER